MTTKKFELNKLKRGKDLSSAVDMIEEKLENDIKQKIVEVKEKPTQEKIIVVTKEINKSINLTSDEKRILTDNLRDNFINVFNFQNCPDDYEDLKSEAKFLSGITQYSFLLMAQRLLKIKKRELYKQDGYHDFKSFIENELTITRQTAYNYVDILDYFGVKTFLHDDNINPSKLLPVLPLLKTDDPTIPKEDIKKRFIMESKSKSARALQKEARELKIRYGLINPEKEDYVTELFNKTYYKIPKRLTNSDVDNIKAFIIKLENLVKQYKE